MSTEQDRRFEAARRALGAPGEPEEHRRHFETLEALAEEGHAEAQVLSGTCHQYGMLAPIDLTLARSRFQAAAEQGHAGASFRLGELDAASGDAARQSQARTLLQDAVAGGNLAAGFQLAYMLDEGIGGGAAPAEATGLLDRIARAGYGLAQLALSDRLARGHTVPADAAGAMFWAGHAASQGTPLAGEHYRSLAAQGHAPCGAPPELDPDDGAAVALPTRIEELIDRPRVQTIHAMMTLTERADIIQRAAPFLAPSKVVGAKPGAAKVDQARTSGDAVIYPGREDVIVRHHRERAARLLGIPAARSEPMIVLRYGQGDEYTPHYDFFSDRYDDQLAGGGQRVATVLCYLNTVPAGGATGFPLLDLDVAAIGGQGLRFDNMDPDGVADKRTLHCGRPVEAGEKWLATLWFREEDYVPPEEREGQGPQDG